MASVTNTYARAFADAVFEGKHDPARMLQEAQWLAAAVAGSKDLREVWAAPSISAEQKRAVLDAIVAREGVSKIVRNFIAVLIDHHRIQFLDAIVAQFERDVNERLGYVDAEIASSRELTPEERGGLEGQIARLTGKQPKARYVQDATLLGGAVIRLGSTIYDGSVKGKLEEIREQVVGANS